MTLQMHTMSPLLVYRFQICCSVCCWHPPRIIPNNLNPKHYSTTGKLCKNRCVMLGDILSSNLTCGLIFDVYVLCKFGKNYVAKIAGQQKFSNHQKRASVFWQINLKFETLQNFEYFVKIAWSSFKITSKLSTFT